MQIALSVKQQFPIPDRAMYKWPKETSYTSSAQATDTSVVSSTNLLPECASENTLAETGSEIKRMQANPKVLQERMKTYFILDGRVHLLPIRDKTVQQQWNSKQDLREGILISVDIARTFGMIMVSNKQFRYDFHTC